MHNPIEYGIGYCLLGEDVEPGCHGQLADDDGRFSCMPVLDYFHDIILLLAVQRGQSEVIEDEQIRFCQLFKPFDQCPSSLATFRAGSNFWVL